MPAFGREQDCAALKNQPDPSQPLGVVRDLADFFSSSVRVGILLSSFLSGFVRLLRSLSHLFCRPLVLLFGYSSLRLAPAAKLRPWRKWHRTSCGCDKPGVVAWFAEIGSKPPPSLVEVLPSGSTTAVVVEKPDVTW